MWYPARTIFFVVGITVASLSLGLVFCILGIGCLIFAMFANGFLGLTSCVYPEGLEEGQPLWKFKNWMGQPPWRLRDWIG